MCAIDVALMLNTTDGTRPHSDGKLSQSTRAGALAAVRASTACPRFVDLHVLRSKPEGFVSQERAGDAPGGIIGRFGKAGFGEFRTGHVAHNDQAGHPGNGGGDLMRPVLPDVGDFGMEGLGTPRLPRSLCLRQRLRIVPGDIGTGERCWKVRTGKLISHPEVDADVGRSRRPMQVWDLTLEAHVPSPPAVLCETAGCDGPDDRTGQPQTEVLTAVGHGIASQANAAGLERNPAARALATAPLQRDLLELLASGGIFFRNKLHRLRMQSQLFRRSRCERVQIICRQKDFVALERSNARLVAIVPHVVDRRSHLQQMFACCGIFYSVVIGEYSHTFIVPNGIMVVLAKLEDVAASQQTSYIPALERRGFTRYWIKRCQTCGLPFM